MNERTQIMSRQYKPALAIIVYQHENYAYYLESHSISENGAILEGKPLQQETMQGIVDTFFDEQQNRSTFHGILPGNMLSFTPLPGGQYRMIWFRPQEVRFLHFTQSLHLPSGESWVPPLLYVAEKKSLSIYALSSDERPKADDPLLVAPFHNVYANGSVCLGSAKVKRPAEKTYEAAMKYWEDLFWLSEFTHLNGGQGRAKVNINITWKELIEGGAKEKWKLEDLIPFEKKLTIKSVL